MRKNAVERAGLKDLPAFAPAGASNSDGSELLCRGTSRSAAFEMETS